MIEFIKHILLNRRKRFMDLSKPEKVNAMALLKLRDKDCFSDGPTPAKQDPRG